MIHKSIFRHLVSVRGATARPKETLLLLLLETVQRIQQQKKEEEEDPRLCVLIFFSFLS